MLYSSSRAARAWPALLVVFGLSISINSVDAQQPSTCDAQAIVGTVVKKMLTAQPPPSAKTPLGDAAVYAKLWTEQISACAQLPQVPQTQVCNRAVLDNVADLYARVAAANDNNKPISDDDLTQQAMAFATDVSLCGNPASQSCEEISNIAAFELMRWIQQHPGATADQIDQIQTKYMDSVNAVCFMLVQKKVCSFKQAVLPKFLEEYYSLPDSHRRSAHKREGLSIDSAVYGDLTHGHVCNATAYFQTECERMRKNPPQADASKPDNDMTPSAGPTFCRVRRSADASTPPSANDFCGFDPSPQADNKQVAVWYRCGETGKQLTAPGDTQKINLICGDAPPYRRPLPDNPTLALQLAFFGSGPCSVKLPAKP